MSPIRARKTLRLGPVRVNFTQAGYTSWGVRLGPWSWNARTKAHRLNLPGPWHWTTRATRQRRKNQEDSR